MTVETLLQEIRRAVGTRPPGAPAVQKKLALLALRLGVAAQLRRVVETGDLVSAQLAALPLPHATDELVRRGLVRAAKKATGERRTVLLAALTDEELSALVGRGEPAAQDLVRASGTLAANDPAAFVELVCERRRTLETGVVEQVEAVRAAYGLGAGSLYGPLLDRNLSADARVRVLEILGRVAGAPVRALLEREERRAPDAQLAKVARRERMRQGALGVEPQAPRGQAFLGVPGPSEALAVVVFEALPDGRHLRTTLALRAEREVERFTAPVDDARAHIDAQASDARWSRLSLGQLRALLETLPAARRTLVGPLLERLSQAPAEPLAPASPTTPMEPAPAAELVGAPPWRAWRPLARTVRMPASLLEDGRDAPREAWPPHLDALPGLAQARLATALARPGAAERLSQGLRTWALHLQLRGDARAGAVSAEAVLVARRRSSALALALTERELVGQLVAEAPLPDAWREELRERIRQLLGDEDASWARVQRLDLVQAAAEGVVRDGCEDRAGDGLPRAQDVALSSLVALADVARASLSDAAFRRRARTRRLEVVSDAARGWLAVGPPAAVSAVAGFAARICLEACAHRCFEARHPGEPLRAWNGACPAGPARS